MSQQEKYDSHNRGSARLWIISVVACLLCVVFFMAGISFARYVANWYGNMDTDIAQWNIKVNDVLLTKTSAVPIKLYYRDGDIYTESNSTTNLLRPGQSGYFDVELDPDGTEVSFSCRITLDKTTLPANMSIRKYSEDLGADQKELPVGGSLDYLFLLAEAGESGVKFTSANKLTVRYYWDWADTPFDETLDYSVSVRISV